MVERVAGLTDRVCDLGDELKAIRQEFGDEVKSLRRAIYTVALSVTGSAIVFALTVFQGFR